MYSIFFQICSMFYITLLTIEYFGKKRLNTIENRIYSYLIVNVIVALILDVSSIFTIRNIDCIPIINTIICKLYLASVVSWITLFTSYILVVACRYNTIDSEGEYFNKKVKHINRCLMLIYSIYLILLFILPLKYYLKDAIYSYGPAANISYGFSGIFILLEIISIFTNIKKIPRIKILPVFLFMICGITAIIIQINNPNILLITFIDTFITFLMYFTIENPDLKLIEDLNEAKDQAEKANRAKSEFLSSMSHEIRTPLNAIVGFSQGLMEEDLPDTAKEEVGDIINASQNLLQLVNGILDISKIEANKLEIVNTEYNFQKVFDELVALTKSRLGDKGLDFMYTTDPTIPPVLYGDYVRVKQIILNLLTNAVKYTKKGYIIFNVSSVRKDDVCRLIISVEDSGIGIKEENIDKLFNKFERFDLEKNITIEGTGLGLAITKKLVHLMDGQIIVQSKYGEGSKFTVSLDQRVVAKKLSDIEPEATKDDETKFVGCGNKILIVDDNNINLKVAARLLKDYNVDITTVSSGRECINKILDGNKYELILLDDMMPGMSGVETLSNLKKIIGFEVPTVALTANAITGMREKYLESGFDEYLSKPIDKNELEKILKKFLNDSKENIEYKNEENNMDDGMDSNIQILINNGVDLDSSLELLGDMETYNETIRDFYNESNTRLSNIEKYKNDKDMPNYAILVHAMKSDSKYLGFKTLAELSYNHEMASKANDIDYVNNNYDELMNEANRIMNLIGEYLKGE